MVKLDAIRAGNAALVRSQPLVAVFVGGTSGIGEHTARALATTHGRRDGRGLSIYIVGRNEAAAGKTISDCLAVCPGGRFQFVKAEDLALINDVDKLCVDLERRIEDDGASTGPAPRIDILVMSQSVFKPGTGRRETKEGLDTDMSLLYYSRMRIATKLLPLLLASSLPAHVISVYAAGMEAEHFPDDLSLRKDYSFVKARAHSVYMKKAFMESLARKYPGRLSLAHVFPGLVITDGFHAAYHPLWFKAAFFVLRPLLWLVATPQLEAGERMLFMATPRFPAAQHATENDGKPTDNNTPPVEQRSDIAPGSDGISGSGAYAVSSNGEAVSSSKVKHGKPAESDHDRVWEHTTTAFAEIEAGRVFCG